MQVELPHYRSTIESLGYRVHAPALNGRQQFSATELLEYSQDLVGIVAGDDELSQEFFDGCPNLKTVIRWGIGMDSVDLSAARDHGVTVRNTPGVFGGEVADMAFGYILNLARGHASIDAAVRNGQWPSREGVSLAGKKLGIIGFGAIGQEVAKRGKGFDMQICVYDPYTKNTDPEVLFVELDELLESSHFVVLACPLSPETFHLINASRLTLMRPDSFLINVARGPVVSESDLVNALREHQIAGAALDVFETEPLPLDSELREFPHLILGAHNASNTREGVVRASRIAIDFLIEELTK
jgi:D-3-phosphoglycerate dehydrogenase